MSKDTTPVALARSFTEAWTSHDMDTAAGHLAADNLSEQPL